jgi:hypothetical protein
LAATIEHIQSAFDALGDPRDLPAAVLAEVLRAALAELETEREATRAARRTARVLAHAWRSDSRPPIDLVEQAEQWDAYGNEEGGT